MIEEKSDQIVASCKSTEINLNVGQHNEGFLADNGDDDDDDADLETEEIDLEKNCDDKLGSTTSLDSLDDFLTIISPNLPTQKDDHHEPNNKDEDLMNSKSPQSLGWTIREPVETMEKCGKKDMKGCKRYWGLCLGILSSFIFSLSTLTVKLLSDYHPFTVTLWRIQGILVPSIFISLYTTFVQKKNVFETIHPACNTGKRKLALFLFLRSTAGTVATVFFNYALLFLSLPDSSVIAFSTPVFVTFLACLFLKETCGLVNVFAALVTLAGVIVIIRPPFLTGAQEMDTNLLIGAILAFASMVLNCCIYICLRVLKELHYSLVTLGFGIIGCTECVIFCLIVGELSVPKTSWDGLLAVALALSTFLGQVCSTLATKYEEAGIVALTRTFDVIFAFIWQFLFLNVTPNIFSLIGSLIVISGIILVVVQKYLQNLDKNHPARKMLCLLLK